MDNATQRRVEAFEQAMRRLHLEPEKFLLKLFRAEEAAELLGKPLGTLRNMTYRREIAVVRDRKSVRYRLLDLLVWIEDHSVAAKY